MFALVGDEFPFGYKRQPGQVGDIAKFIGANGQVGVGVFPCIEAITWQDLGEEAPESLHVRGQKTSLRSSNPTFLVPKL